MKDLGITPPEETYKSYTIMGKTFDPARLAQLVKSFEIGKA